MSDPSAPNADRFAPLAPERAAGWVGFATGQKPHFASLIGLQVEELRTDYARMRLPFRPEIAQKDGVMHGGAIATLIDTVVVPAIGTHYDQRPMMVTLSMNVNYLAAVRHDAVAEGWVEQRGVSTVFCRAEVRTPGGKLAATGTLVYKVDRPRA